MIRIAAPRDFNSNDEFYRKANKRNWSSQKPKAGLFKPKPGEGMSVDWTILTSPEETARRDTKPADYPIRLVVLEAELIWKLGLTIEYSAKKPTNMAHCDIWGDMLTDGSSYGLELRKRLVDEYKRHLGPFDM